nr:hypothetical protein CFP56_73014 [Quercus suber]
MYTFYNTVGADNDQDCIRSIGRSYQDLKTSSMAMRSMGKLPSNRLRDFFSSLSDFQKISHISVILNRASTRVQHSSLTSTFCKLQ